MAKQGKRVENMTTDETMEHLFPKRVVEEVKRLAGKARDKARSVVRRPTTKER